MAGIKQVTSAKPNGIRAVGIVINDANILLIKREHNHRHYFTFPGGGVEAGETNEEAVIRELREEANITVSVKRLLYHLDLENDADHFFYECVYDGGELELGGEELIETKSGNIHEPIWFPLDGLPDITLYPLEVRDWLIADIRFGFPTNPRLSVLKPGEMRN